MGLLLSTITIVDLINSISEANFEDKKNFFYEIIFSRFNVKVTKMFADNNIYKQIENSSNQYININTDNNIVIKRTGSVGIRSCIDIEDNSANIIKSNNNYFGSSSVNIGVLNGTTYSTLLNWQNAAVDNNSISSDPVFISPLTGNLTPTSTLLNNAGVNITNISTDYAGITRNNPPDIGAFEYSVNACSGTPTAGNLTAPNNVCSGVSFGMSLANFALGTGITFQWQSSPASSNTFTNISGATLPTYTANQSNAVKYRVVTKCTNSVLQQISNVVTVNMSQVSLCYCASYATGVDGSDIKGVTFGSLSNSSTCTQTGGSGSILNSYSDYTGLVTPGKFTRGSKIPFSISIGTCDNVSNAYLKAYIDYNIDGDFSDPGEEIYSSNTFVTMNGTEVSGIINIQ
mgnify:CR=1 FL=1